MGALFHRQLRGRFVQIALRGDLNTELSVPLLNKIAIEFEDTLLTQGDSSIQAMMSSLNLRMGFMGSRVAPFHLA